MTESRTGATSRSDPDAERTAVEPTATVTPARMRDEHDAAPLVSVVVPTYNRADSLTPTIESVLAQTVSDLELLVVDDASTDDTESVVTGYDDDRVQYLRHDENRGGSAARNTGIEAARGTYVALLDSDDLWEPRKLERQVACLESRSDDWVAAYCGYDRQRSGPDSRLRVLVDAILPSVEREGMEGGEELVTESLLLRGFSTGGSSTLLVRRDVVQRMGGFDESFQRQQDWEFRNRLLREGKLAYVDAVLVRKEESAPPAAETIERSIRHYLDTFGEDVAALEAEGHDVTGRHLFIVARAFLSEGNFRKGLYYLRRSHLPTVRQYADVAYAAARGAATRARARLS
ncbi:glycosyltransferase family 2 protein [Salinigranum sp.]|uniref:glycosyltransferase family 2 protein n=1 Tax=Salinigranum sp. TaxID=1966351 RepID=UPI0035620D04